MKGTLDIGLIFGWDSDFGIGIVGYADSNYAKNQDKIWSTMGYIFTLARSAVSWRSMLQTPVALSTMEVEYMVLTEAVQEEIWLKGLVGDLDIQQDSTVGHCDNQCPILSK